MANFPGSISTNANLYVAVNGIQTTLAANILSTDTTILLTSTTSFPTTGFVTIENNEVVSYTGISGASLTGCTRGADGTTALAHNSGVTVGLTIVAAHHNLLKDEVIAIETALGASYSQTSSATANTVMLRDTNANTQINHVTENFATTATAAGTTVLSVTSAQVQQFTGTTTQTVTLPDCTTLVVGFRFSILNRSTGTVTVNNNGGSLQQAVGAGTQFVFTCTNIGSANGVWDVSSAAGSGTVTSVSGTANQITSTGGPTPVLAIANPLTLPGPISGTVTVNDTSTGVTETLNSTGGRGSAIQFEASGTSEIVIGCAGVYLGTTDTTDCVIASQSGGVKVFTNGQSVTAALAVDTSNNTTLAGTLAMGANKITGLSNGTAATDAAAFGQIKLLQTVFASGTTNTASTSSSYASTVVTASITPTSSSNRVKITMTSVYTTANGTNSGINTTIFKNSTTDLGGGTRLGGLDGSFASRSTASVTVVWIDSPATTSATTYTLYSKNDDNTTSVSINNGATWTVVLEEIV